MRREIMGFWGDVVRSFRNTVLSPWDAIVPQSLLRFTEDFFFAYMVGTASSVCFAGLPVLGGRSGGGMHSRV